MGQIYKRAVNLESGWDRVPGKSRDNLVSESSRPGWGQEEGRVGLDEVFQCWKRFQQEAGVEVWVVPGSAIPNRGRGTRLTGSHKGRVSWCHGKWGLQ